MGGGIFRQSIYLDYPFKKKNICSLDHAENRRPEGNPANETVQCH